MSACAQRRIEVGQRNRHAAGLFSERGAKAKRALNMGVPAL